MQLIKELGELEQILNAKLETEKFERVELQQKGDVEVLVCEPERGPLLFESDEEPAELDHMNDSEQPEDLMTEASNETVRSCDFKTDNLCTVVGLEENRQCFKTVKNMKEYLPENESFEAEYDKETKKETICYSEQVQRDIIKTDVVGTRLADNLKSSLSLNQHTDVLTEKLKGRLKQCAERLPEEEEEVQTPYIFYFDNCLRSAYFVAETRTYLAQVGNQMKEEEEEHLLKDVKKYLEEEEGPCDDGSIVNEEMGDHVKFPKFTPSKIIELYREIDFHRRKLEE